MKTIQIRKYWMLIFTLWVKEEDLILWMALGNRSMRPICCYRSCGKFMLRYQLPSVMAFLTHTALLSVPFTVAVFQLSFEKLFFFFSHNIINYGSSIQSSIWIQFIVLCYGISIRKLHFCNELIPPTPHMFLHAFFLICPSCPFQNLSLWPKTYPFFQFCTFLHP